MDSLFDKINNSSKEKLLKILEATTLTFPRNINVFSTIKDSNSIGIIDSDYYDNESNEGHFYFQYYNFNKEELHVKKGDVIGQVIFMKFLTCDDDCAEGIRTGGFGSTDK